MENKAKGKLHMSTCDGNIDAITKFFSEHKIFFSDKNRLKRLKNYFSFIWYNELINNL